MGNKILLLSIVASLSCHTYAETKYLSFTEGYTSERTFDTKKNVSENNSYIDVTYQFQGAKISQTSQGDIISIENSFQLLKTGEPSLPYFSDIFLVPSENVTIEEIKSAYKEFENIDVIPSQGDYIEGSKPMEPTKGEIYGVNSLYPSGNEQIVRLQKFRGALLATINTYPIRINPVTKKARCYSSITYRIHMNDVVYPKVKSSTLKMLQSTISNPNSTNLYKGTTLRSLSDGIKSEDDNVKKYVFITHPVLYDVTRKFAEWKATMGYNCKIMTNSQWTSEKIKDSIAAEQARGGIDYLLIVGDNDIVPPMTINLERRNGNEIIENISIPTDKLYATSDEENYNADFAIGRISDNEYMIEDKENAIETIFQKIKKYESVPPISSEFYRNATHIGYFQDTDTTELYDGIESSHSFIYFSEALKKLIEINTDIKVSRVYSKQSQDVQPIQYYNGEPLPMDLLNPDIWRNDHDSIKSKINNGALYVLNNTHGDGPFNWSNPDFYTVHAEDLTNGDLLPVIFSSACYVGKFADNYCLAESFLKNPKGGAVGMTANTHYGWVMANRYLMKNLLDLNVIQINNCNSVAENMEIALTENQMDNDSNYQYKTHVHLATHYFGDPSMEMYSSEPGCIIPHITRNDGTIIVDVDEEGCTITLTSAEDHLDMDKFKSYTGMKHVEFTGVDFPYTICVTKSNFVPFISDNDIIIQNKNYKQDTTTVNAFNIIAGNNVSSTESHGDVVCQKGHTQFQAQNSIVLRDGFKVNDGATFKAILVEGSCSYRNGNLLEPISDDYIFVGNNNHYNTFDNNTTDIAEETSEQHDIFLYPNPSEGNFSISFGQEEGEKNVTITNVSGAIVYSDIFTNEVAEINLSHQSRGIYFVKIITNGKTITKQVIKK